MPIIKLFVFIAALMLPQSALSDLTYTVLRVDETYDGRAKGDDYTGAWIKIVNVKSNGDQHILPILQFEISGNYGETVDAFGFMNGRTVTKIDSRNASRVEEWGGKKHYRFWISKGQPGSKWRRFLNSLKPADQETIKAICGSLSDEEFVEGLIPKMISANRFGEKYKNYWSNKSRLREIVSLAKQCNRGLGQGNSNASKFVLAKKSKITISALCGFSLHNSIKFGRSEKTAIQTTLKELGHYEGAIDGDFGRNSCKALKSYLTGQFVTLDNNKLLMSHIGPLLSKGEKKVTPASTASSSKLATSEMYGIVNNSDGSNSTEEKGKLSLSAADNKLSLENAALNETIADKEKLITELQIQIESIKKTVRSSQKEAIVLKALTSDQKKLATALKERITALEIVSISMETELVKAGQMVLEQASTIDSLQTTSTKLKQNKKSLETQNKKFEASELEANKQIQSLLAAQAALREEKTVLLTSNEALKLENSSLLSKLKKLNSKKLVEGGLSGKSLGSNNNGKDDTSSATNSLGENLISKKLIKDLQNENSEFRQDKVEYLKKNEALEIRLQTALGRLETAISSIDRLKQKQSEQTTIIGDLQTELSESKTKTQSQVVELQTLMTQLAELQSYRAKIADKESQEIEMSKIALKAIFQNKKALVLSSVAKEAEVTDYISSLIEELGLSPEADTFDVFLASDNTFSITLGLGTQEECKSMRDQLLTFGSIPEDSFCGDWDEYIAAFDVKNGQLLATVGKNYFAIEEVSHNVTSTNTRNASKVNSLEVEQSTNKQPVAVKEPQTTVGTTDSSIQNKASMSEMERVANETPSQGNITSKGLAKGTLNIYRNTYKNFIKNQSDEKFAYCRAISLQLRGDTLFFNGEYYEDALRIFLQENALEVKRRGLSEEVLNNVQLQYKDQFENKIPEINKRVKSLSLMLFSDCEGANIAP